MCHRLRERFVNDFNWSSGHPTHFYKSHWETFSVEDEETHAPSIIYLAYRAVYSLLFVSALIYSTNCQADLYFIFLTNWSFLGQTIYSLLAFSNVLYEYLTRRLKPADRQTRYANATVVVTASKDVEMDIVVGEGGRESDSGDPAQIKSDSSDNNDNVDNCRKTNVQTINTLQKLLWIIVNIIYLVPYGVAGGYWLVVYKPNSVRLACERFRSHYIVHGLNTVMALLDICITAIPIRFFHFLIPTLFIGAYCFFTFIYEVAGGRYREEKEHIYSVLDWRNNPGKAVATSFLVAFVTPLGHFLFCYLVYKAKCWIIPRCKKSTHQPKF